MSSSLLFGGSFARSYQGRSQEELTAYIKKQWLPAVKYPSYDEEEEFDVYKLSKNSFSHCSLLFLLPYHIEGFMIHMTVDPQEGRVKFILEVINIRVFENDYPNLKADSLGKTKTFTAFYIITTAEEVLKGMGNYTLCCNNCRRYCERVAEKIGLSASIETFTIGQLCERYDKKS